MSVSIIRCNLRAVRPLEIDLLAVEVFNPIRVTYGYSLAEPRNHVVRDPICGPSLLRLRYRVCDKR